jgi:hypothetical protein
LFNFLWHPSGRSQFLRLDCFEMFYRLVGKMFL